jgi:hypothetical protein
VKSLTGNGDEKRCRKGRFKKKLKNMTEKRRRKGDGGDQTRKSSDKYMADWRVIWG